MSTIPLDKSWMNKRGSAMYIYGVRQFQKFVEDNANGESLFPCPCVRCRNSRGNISVDDIGVHLLSHGIDTNYVTWIHHGENINKQVIDVPMTKVVEPDDAFEYPRMNDLVDDVFLNMQTVEADDGINDLNDTVEESFGSNPEGGPELSCEPETVMNKKYQKYKEKATVPLYNGCPKDKTTLSTIIELQNFKTRFSWSGNSVTMLLKWLKTLLPDDCNLPDNYPNMKNTIKDMGMECKTIHACANGCILYWKEYEGLVTCPKCGSGRYKVYVDDDDNESGKVYRKEAKKVVKYFPLIPRLKRFFSIPWIGEAMTWHKDACSDGNLMRHPCDSAQWTSTNMRWPEFASDSRNLRLAISTDGFNPRGNLSNAYSCWPVIITPLNLPPSLCMKKEFCLLTLLISGPKAPGKNIDVYLEPLVEELKELWADGVSTWDAYTKSNFRLKAMLFWGIHDFPAYGTLAGCNVHGYNACPICVDDVESERLSNSRKICYRGHRRFLPTKHKFRDDKGFNKDVEHRRAPRRLSGEEVERRIVEILEGRSTQGRVSGQKRKNMVDNDNVNDEPTNNIAPPWSRRSILFDLPYWKFVELRHNIDVMHTEKNVIEHLLNILLNVSKKTKDGENARKDMENMGTHKRYWLSHDTETGKTSMPKASFALTKKEKNIFMNTLKELKLPSGFSSKLSNCVLGNPLELRGLKSHDYHVIMQHLLPVLLRHVFRDTKDKDLRIAIQRISLFFNILCAKVINKTDLQLAHKGVIEAICVLEKELPPSFFVISVHCMVHLTEEAMLGGPVRYRWMYPFER